MVRNIKVGRFIFNISIVLIILITSISGISQAETTKTSEFEKLVFAGGPSGGNWYGLAGSIAASLLTIL